LIASSWGREWIATPVVALVMVTGAIADGHASTSALSTSRTAPGPSGAVEPIRLPGPAAVGQTARTETAIQTTIDGGPVSLLLATSSAITAVNGDGSYVARSVIDSVAVTNAPASADISTWGFGRLEGVAFDQAYASTGTPLAGGSRSIDAQSLVLDSVAMASVGFPAQPVGVGDSWTVAGQIGSEGVSFTVTYQCRLVTVVGDTYTVDVAYAETFRAEIDGGVAEGTIAGTGTLSGLLDNPLAVWGQLNQTIDGVTMIDGTATPMRRDTSVALNTTEGWIG